MKLEFFKVFIIVFIKQIIFLLAFMLFSQEVQYQLLLVPVAIAFFLYLHFSYSKKIHDFLKLKIEMVTFDFYSFASWILSGAIITFIIGFHPIYELLPSTGGFLSGFEYTLVPLFFISYLVIICIIKFCVLIYNEFKKD